MKIKPTLLTAIAAISLATSTLAQVPNYVPTNGLVGWWPFNGNANDESGTGNNGTINNATLTTDRFGQANKAYSFNGNSSYIEVLHNSSQNLSNAVSFSLWINPPDYTTNNNQTRIPLSKMRTINTYGIGFETVDGIGSCCGPQFFANNNTGSGGLNYEDTVTLVASSWTHLVGTYDGSTLKLYKNAVLLGSVTGVLNLSSTIQNLYFGREGSNAPSNYYKGLIDDIGFWNRALTQQEVTALYNSCQLSVNTQPTNQTININNNVQFIVGSSDTNTTYQWQTDLGVGFQNLNSVGQYSGTTNDTLTVSNTTMSNHNQQFRCIISSGSCADTSEVAVLTVNNNVGINENTLSDLFFVFPNPAQNVMNVTTGIKHIGEVYTIYDYTGKVVLTGKLNAENTTIELVNLSAGTYLLSVGENLKQTFKVIKE